MDRHLPRADILCPLGARALSRYHMRFARAAIAVPGAHRGAVAQLGERRVRNAKVGSSILLRSTTDSKQKTARKRGFFVSRAPDVARIRSESEAGPPSQPATSSGTPAR